MYIYHKIDDVKLSVDVTTYNNMMYTFRRSDYNITKTTRRKIQRNMDVFHHVIYVYHIYNKWE